MKRFLTFHWLILGTLFGISLAMLGQATPSNNTSTLAPDLNFLLHRSAQTISGGYFDGAGSESVLENIGFERAADDRMRLGVLIRTHSVGALKDRGVDVHSVAGDIVTARVTLEQLEAMQTWPEVIYVEGVGGLTWAADSTAAQPLLPELARSVKLTGATELHEQGITGKGVVIGVVDTGIDWQHLDFRVDRDGDRFEEGSRLLSIWDQTQPGNRPPGFNYGVEYTRADIERALVTDDDVIKHFDANPSAPSHGTHAMGIVGGDGSSSSMRLVGMAPEADLIAVKSPLNADAVIDAVNYIFNKAGDRPAVVNLSLGGHLGAHDGTSNFEKALDALVGEPGRVIVVSAGNEGDDLIHVGGDLAATAKVSFTFDLIEPLEKSRFAFDFWYEPGDPLEVRVIGPNGEVFGPVATGELVDGSMTIGGVFIDNARNGSNPNNGLNELLINVYGTLFGSQHPLQTGRWIIELRAPRLGTTYDGWALDVPFSSFNADNRSTITIPATAHKLIAVGAYVSRTQWLGLDQRFHSFTEDNPLGKIAIFSSLGPTRDGRIKPDLVAPGSMIASALSSDSINLVDVSNVLVDGVHYVNRGTSFSAPHVSGAAALLLQLNPKLTAAQVLQRLKQNALNDEFTGFGTNNVWGSGKLDLDFDAPSLTPSLVIAQALDMDGDGIIGDEEILSAIRHWISGDTLSGATEQPITDSIITWLIGLWIQATPLS